MDIHHVTNKAHSMRLLKNFNPITGLSIVLRAGDHYYLSKQQQKDFKSNIELVNVELEALWMFSNVPEKIIEMLKNELIKRYY